ncbi:MAG: hypothetical protein R3C99_05510 [Pirellulaceae bacterium]|nr:hypothetical protein [Planctomycetales bacterium]MCA9204933.1 hypothetical protein [Planctomycetales bacterium]MCA9209390.1 hypothetical protein [Planctomycetales bacterium]MCA9220355.1 hypothetical protein [Planctomycetales bacterium]MCA9226498.1 hypothetical protein [Planctomycetales bacterium]
MLKSVFRLVLAGATFIVATRGATAAELHQIQRLPGVTPVESRLNDSEVWVIRGQNCTSGGCCDNGGGYGCCDNGGGLGCCDSGCDSGCCDSYCDCTVDYGCCGLPGAYVLAEATFFKYHRADGVPAGSTFDYEVSPRITLGYTGQSGLGGRLRYWEYDHAAGAASVDTYNLDAEIYQRVALGCKTTVEVAGGVRYNEFEEIGIGLGPVSGSGWGAMASLEGTRKIRRGYLYARARHAMLFDDSTAAGVPLSDINPTQTELTLGWRGMRCLANGAVATLDLAVESQNWSNYSIGRFAPAPVDVGFFGFTAGLGVLY